MAASRFGKNDFGNTLFATKTTSHGMSIMFISIRSNIGWYRVCATGRIRHSTDMYGRSCWHRIGPEMLAKAEQISESGRISSPHERSDMRDVARRANGSRECAPDDKLRDIR